MARDYINPGAAAAQSILTMLTERAAQQRQAELDAMNRANAEQTRLVQQQQIEASKAAIAREQEEATSLRSQRDAGTALNNQRLTLGVLDTVSPGASIDPALGTRMRRDGLTHLIGPYRQSETANGPSDDPRSWVNETFRGTPQQQALQQMLDDPNTPDAVKQYMQARSVAGDENLPYQMFQPQVAQTTPVVRVSRDRRGIETFVDGQWTPVTGEVPKGAHFITEPAPTGQVTQGAVDRRVDNYQRQFESNAIVKRFATQNEAEEFINSLDPQTNNPADDQALIYAFAKAMDPDSVVREGEYATVQKYSQTWTQRLKVDVNRIINNDAFLTPDARQHILATIRGKVASGRKSYINFRNEYAKKVNRALNLPDDDPSGASYLTEFDTISQGPEPRQAPASTTRVSTPSRVTSAPKPAPSAQEFDFVPGKGLVPRK
jgi:hypothetical protein